jgi:hypothetical protein
VGKNPKAPSPYFDRTIKALRRVAPLCIAARFDDGFKHCVEASVAGAEALNRRKGIKARPMPCAVAVRHVDSDVTLTIGFASRQIYDRLPVEGRPSFEEWRATEGRDLPDNETPFHEIIEARFGRERALIDLTFGQLRQTGAPHSETLPLNVGAVVGEGWYEFDSPPWTIGYMEPPHDAKALAAFNADVKKYSNPEFVADIHDMMELALSVDLDPERLMTALARQQPETLRTCQSRIRALTPKK